MQQMQERQKAGTDLCGRSNRLLQHTSKEIALPGNCSSSWLEMRPSEASEGSQQGYGGISVYATAPTLRDDDADSRFRILECVQMSARAPRGVGQGFKRSTDSSRRAARVVHWSDIVNAR
jgi:hypothetical protein